MKPPETKGDSAQLAASGFLTVAEAAQFLAVSRTTIYELLRSGAIPSARFGRARRIPRQALIDFAESALSASGSLGE